MKRAQRSAVISLILGVLSLCAIGVSYLALTDIRHGEADVHQEWTALKFAALVAIAFHASAFTTLWRVLHGFFKGVERHSRQARAAKASWA